MYLNWLEIRHKKSGITWKKSPFQKVNILTAEDPVLPSKLLDLIEQLQQFALNQTPRQFANVICRTAFQAAHAEYLWYLKTTENEKGFFIDEEELYEAKNIMIMRRGFAEMTVGDGPVQNISLTESMLLQCQAELSVLSPIHKAFTNIMRYEPTDASLSEHFHKILAAPHGQLILLDGSRLSEPVDIAAILNQRQDLQLFITHCANPATIQISMKGKNIICELTAQAMFEQLTKQTGTNRA